MPNGRSLLKLAVLTTCGWLLCQAANADATERESINSAGTEADRGSHGAFISGQGRFVAFYSYASNLVAGDTNERTDIFVRDRQTGATERVSVGSAGDQADGHSYYPVITPGGRFVAFRSDATNLVLGDSNGRSDVFVRDLQAGTTERVSVSSAGAEGNDQSYFYTPSISADGRYVAFYSYATNLVADDINGRADIFLRDRLAGTTERVSISSAGTQSNGDSHAPSITPDGRFVAFLSFANNLVGVDANGSYDVFVRDREAATTELVSVSSAELQGNSNSYEASISGNGRFVAFSSYAANLVDGDTNGNRDMFVRDRQAGTTERASIDSLGAEGIGDSHSAKAAISADGRFVVFSSFAANLVPDDTNGKVDVFLRDRETATTRRLSVDSAGAQADGSSDSPSISAGGVFVAFRSGASNLVTGDANGDWDVFVRALPRVTVAVSASPAAGGSVSGGGAFPPGSSRTVTAMPNAGWRFVNWTEGGSAVSAEASYSFTLSADRTLVANFEQIADHTISLSASPSDSGAVGGQGTFATGSVQTVTAMPNAHYRFVNWTENGVDVSTEESYEFTVGADRTLVANFEQLTYSISVSASPPEGGTVGGSGTFGGGSAHTVTASAHAGWRFVNWTEGGSQASDSPSFSFTVEGDQALVGNFEQILHTIALSASPAEGGAVEGQGDFPEGNSQTVIATANPGYALDSWTENGVEVSNSVSYTFTLNADRTLVASFEDPLRQDDLLVDFGARGVWQYLNDATWTKLRGPVRALTTGDLNDSGVDEAIASGDATLVARDAKLVARYDNSGSWRKLHATAPVRLVAGDFDGAGGDDLVIDLGGRGLSILKNDTLPFTRLHVSPSEALVAGDLNGDGKDEFLADFGAAGLWARGHDGPWRQLIETSPTHIAAADLDGTGRDDVAIDLGAAGLSVRYGDAPLWETVHASASEGLATGDLDGDGKKELIADFGAAGLWARFANSTWEQLATENVGNMLAIDLDRSGKADLVADFGAAGLKARYDNSGAWLTLRPWASEGMAAGGFD